MSNIIDGRPIMTKYEYTRIKGIRIQQLIDGMKPFIKYPEDSTYHDIFELELIKFFLSMKNQ